MGARIKHSSGRVISLGRLLLAALFLLAIWIDDSQPARAPATTYRLLVIYLLFAATMVFITWRNWWLDARMAGPAHAIDVALFAVLVLATHGYTSPYFAFFMFILLAAAIRWGWRITALTAALLTLLYLAAGWIGIYSGLDFDQNRFLVRTGHLVTLSLILIWFGVHQRWTRFAIAEDQLGSRPSLDESPIETALRAAMASVSARCGTFFWKEAEGKPITGLALRDGHLEIANIQPHELGAVPPSPFLFDLNRNRGLARAPKGGLEVLRPKDQIPPSIQQDWVAGEGLAVPVRANGGEGILYLTDLPDLLSDHVDAGTVIADAITVHLQRHSLLLAVEESAESRARLGLARDLHDSLVQFLASAAFRIEAMRRNSAAGRPVELELDELKQLMLEEQLELRGFITALRSGPEVSFGELAQDLKELAERLSLQWGINCTLEVRKAELMIPTRLRLESRQLIREAVANAVRHAGASNVTANLGVAKDALEIEVINDGGDFPARGERPELPASLRERVEQAGGTLDLSRGMGVTRLSLALPLSEDRR